MKIQCNTVVTLILENAEEIFMLRSLIGDAIDANKNAHCSSQLFSFAEDLEKRLQIES